MMKAGIFYSSFIHLPLFVHRTGLYTTCHFRINTTVSDLATSLRNVICVLCKSVLREVLDNAIQTHFLINVKI